MKAVVRTTLLMAVCLFAVAGSVMAAQPCKCGDNCPTKCECGCQDR